jgi:hypothetical protein
VRKIKADIAAAEARAEEHRNVIANSDHNEFIARMSAEQRQLAVQRFGPAGQMTRDAAIAYATAHIDISELRRWGAVAVLLVGVVLGFVGNMLSLYGGTPPTTTPPTTVSTPPTSAAAVS